MKILGVSGTSFPSIQFSIPTYKAENPNGPAQKWHSGESSGSMLSPMASLGRSSYFHKMPCSEWNVLHERLHRQEGDSALQHLPYCCPCYRQNTNVCGKAGGRKGLFGIEHRGFSSTDHSVASDHFLPWQEYGLGISKTSILWKLSSGKTRSNKHSVSEI